MKIVTLVLILRGTRILLGRKQGDPEIGEGTLNGPGGKLEDTDGSTLECAIRETQEEFEIILDPEKLEKCGVILFHAGGVPDFQMHTYRTREFSGEPCETESMVPEWHDVGHIPYERMLESDKSWMPQYIRGEKFNANVFYEKRAEGFLGIEFYPFVD